MTQVRAALGATVASVVSSEGAAVTASDTVVVLESMKMSIPVLAGTAGVLRRLAVRAGDVVREHDLIAVVE